MRINSIIAKSFLPKLGSLYSNKPSVHTVDFGIELEALVFFLNTIKMTNTMAKKATMTTLMAMLTISRQNRCRTEMNKFTEANNYV